MEKTTTVLVDDHSGIEIRSGGWELRRLDDDATFHFLDLTNLLAGLLTNSVLSLPTGEYLRESLERKGVTF